MAAHDKWDEELPDAVALEVDVDAHPGASVVECLDGDIDQARMGPSMPCTAQPVGGFIVVTTDVDARLVPPMRRVVVQ